jgi:hypothetical protein
VVEHHGFMAEEGTDWFPWRTPPSGALGFTMQRGEGPTREYVSVSVVSVPTGGAEARAEGSGSWLNAGTAIQMTNSAAGDVARRVREECTVAAS